MNEAPAPVAAALVGVTSEVVSAYLAKNHIPPMELPALIASVHAGFVALGQAPEAAAEPEKPRPAVPVRKSVTDDYLISLEDGKHYKTLKRHLSRLGLTPDDYRTKWGLRSDYPMVARAYSDTRSQLAKSLGLGSRPRRG